MFWLYLIGDKRETSSKSIILKLKLFGRSDFVSNEILTWEVNIQSQKGDHDL